MVTAVPAKASEVIRTVDKTDLTYGVELEFVFAFHEDELDVGNTDGKANKIIKTLSSEDRESDATRFVTGFNRISPVDLPGHYYNSWGVERPAGSRVKPYDMEPVDIASRKLGERYPDLQFGKYGTLLLGEKTSDKYEKWMITVDHSVCGVGFGNVLKWLPAHGINEADAHRWDTYGLEAVSPVFSTSRPGNAEISSVIDAVKGISGDNHGAFITNQCGFHVHVQAPEELEVLQELAVMLLIYEEEISRFHPQCRRPWHHAARGNILSNRIRTLIRENDRYKMVETSTIALRRKPIDEIRQEVKQEGWSRAALARYMNFGEDNVKKDRNRLVNFLTAVRGDKFPSTIEFRQALGSLNPDDMSRWVDFCVGLVRLAHFYVNNPEEFPMKTWGDRLDVFHLIHHMGLGTEAEDYWAHKQAYYNLRVPTDREWQTDNEVFPEDDAYSSHSDENDDDNDDGGSFDGHLAGMVHGLRGVKLM